MELHFKLADQVIALRFDFVLPGKQLAAQLAALTLQFALLLSGGLKALQIASIAAAAPFAVIMVVACWCLLSALRAEESVAQE